MKTRQYDRLYLQLATLHLAAILLEISKVVMFSKLLLLPLLMAYFLQKTGPVRTAGQRWMLLAMGASWLGDALLLGGAQPNLFIAGLASFLLAQITYAFVFGRDGRVQNGLLRQKPWLALPVLAIGAGMYAYLHPHLGEMRVPVILYILAISSMVLAAIHRFNRVPRGAGFLVVGGASCFLLSDALLAVNKFVAPFPAASVLIMLTYMAAQFLIVKGMVQSSQAAANPND